MKINAVLPCAGRGERAGLGFNKTLALLGEKPVAFVSAEQFAALPEVTRIVVVCGKGEEEDFRRALSARGKDSLCHGRRNADRFRRRGHSRLRGGLRDHRRP